MNRNDFQKLTRERLEDAQALLQKHRYSGAYYLCGYVIECALKACIAKQTQQFDFPPDPATTREIYVHDLEKLIKSAGLGAALDEFIMKDKDFEKNWGLAKDWSEKCRYEVRNEIQARELYEAVTDKKHGVLQWISQRW
jgi:HEPN domain-containing protein